MLDLDRVIAKMDAAGVDRIALIPSLNGPLPEASPVVLSAVRALMRRKSTRSIAEAIHRVTITRKDQVWIPGKGRFPIFPTPDNEAVAEVVGQHPDRFLGWIFLNPSRDDAVLDTLERFRSVPGMIGVKLHPHWHDYKTAILGPVLGRCEELGLPVLIHLGFRSGGDFVAMCQSHPKLRLIAAHAGFPFYDDLWRVASAKAPNLSVDLSSPYINEALARDAVAALGPRRCLFGTDAPYGFHDDDASYDYEEIKGWVERLPVSEGERERIFSANFEVLLAP